MPPKKIKIGILRKNHGYQKWKACQSQETLQLYAKRNLESKRRQRERESPEETQARRAANACYRKRARSRQQAQETAEQAASRRLHATQQAQQLRSRRQACESVEEAAARRTKLAEQARQYRSRQQAHESVLETAARRAKAAKQARQYRSRQQARESEGEAAARRAKFAEQARRQRACESVEEAAARRAKAAKQARQSRSRQRAAVHEAKMAAEVWQSRGPVTLISSQDTFKKKRVVKRNCGPMNQMCLHCNLLNFQTEKATDIRCKSCCHNGTVLLEADRVVGPSLDNNSCSSAINSSLSLENNLLKLPTGPHLQDFSSGSKRKSTCSVPSDKVQFNSETCISNFSSQKLIIKPTNKLSSAFLNVYKNKNLKSCSNPNIPSSYKIDKKSVLNMVQRQYPPDQIHQPSLLLTNTYQIYQPSLLLTNTSQSNNQNTVINLKNRILQEKTSSKPITELFKTVCTSTQININRTAFQSGGQVSMKHSCQPCTTSVIDTNYFSEPQITQPALDELIKIKEEPPDLSERNDLKESANSDFSPLIVNASSVNEINVEKNKETAPSLNIKVKKEDNAVIW